MIIAKTRDKTIVTFNTRQTIVAETMKEFFYIDQQRLGKEYFDAVRNGNLNCIKECINNGIPVDILHDGYTALNLAIYHGKLEIVQCLIINCNANIETQDKYGDTALHCAVYMGYLKVVRFLIKECNANVETKTRHGHSALLHAINCSMMPIVEYLIHECCVDITAISNTGNTVFDLAHRNDQLNDFVLIILKFYRCK
jgi:ankyrin repeat protein